MQRAAENGRGFQKVRRPGAGIALQMILPLRDVALVNWNLIEKDSQ